MVEACAVDALPASQCPFPVLSLITWVAVRGRAAHHVLRPATRPLAVRLIAAGDDTVSAVLSVYIYVVYDREAAGFQFYEKLPLVPPLGISYELGVDGMSRCSWSC